MVTAMDHDVRALLAKARDSINVRDFIGAIRHLNAAIDMLSVGYEPHADQALRPGLNHVSSTGTRHV